MMLKLRIKGEEEAIVLEGNKSLFYPMHVTTLERYLKMELKY